MVFGFWSTAHRTVIWRWVLCMPLFKPAPGKFKDYIALPKSNGYQSLHTVVVGPQGTPLEFQIRTHQMHQVAEAGVAAHWLYKESDHASASPLQRKAHEWMKSLLSVQTRDPGDFLEHVKIDLFPDVVYLFTPKGEIKELPRAPHPSTSPTPSTLTSATAAWRPWSTARPSRLDTELRNGDVVRIETRPEATPHPGWLGFVRTAKAEQRFATTSRPTPRKRAIGFGRRLLDTHCVRLAQQVSKTNTSTGPGSFTRPPPTTRTGSMNPSALADPGPRRSTATAASRRPLGHHRQQGVEPDALAASPGH